MDFHVQMYQLCAIFTCGKAEQVFQPSDSSSSLQFLKKSFLDCTMLRESADNWPGHSRRPCQTLCDQVTLWPGHTICDQTISDKKTQESPIIWDQVTLGDHIRLCVTKSLCDQVTLWPGHTICDQVTLWPHNTICDQVTLLPCNTICDQVTLWPGHTTCDQVTLWPGHTKCDQTISDKKILVCGPVGLHNKVFTRHRSIYLLRIFAHFIAKTWHYLLLVMIFQIINRFLFCDFNLWVRLHPEALRWWAHCSSDKS